MRTLRRIRRRAGFTMIELIIAVALVAIAAVGGLGIFVYAVGANGSSKTAARALALAQSELDALRLADPADVALDLDAYDAIRDTQTEGHAEWSSQKGDEQQLAMSGGMLAPYRDDVDGLTVLGYVSCAENDTVAPTGDCASGATPLARTARIVVIGPDNTDIRLAARIGSTRAGATPSSGGAPAAPVGLVAVQVADDAIDLSWDESAGAASYRVTRDGQVVADTLRSETTVTQGALADEDAGAETELCVRARNARREASAPACVTVLTRPAGVTAIEDTDEVALAWKRPTAIGIAGYQVERRTPADLASYDNPVLESGPVAYWRLADTGASAVNEVSGAPALTFEGAPERGRASLVKESADASVGFDGVRQWATSSQSIPGITTGTSTSLESWVRVGANSERVWTPSGVVNGITMEAESAERIARSGHQFSQESIPGAVGTAVRVTPDDGSTWTSDVERTAPGLRFRTELTTGTWYVWVRTQGPDAAGDSLHAGWADALAPNADNITFDAAGAPNTWTWARATLDGGNAAFDVLYYSGVVSFNIWAREDGVAIDRVFLTKDAGYVPNGETETPSAVPAISTKGTFVAIGDPAYPSPHDVLGVGVGSAAGQKTFGWGSDLIGGFEGVRWLDSGWDFPAPGTYHVVMTVSSTGTATFYVNGQQVGTSAGAAPRDPGAGVWVGGHPHTDGSNPQSRSFPGDIDEVAVYNRELGAQEIDDHYQEGITSLIGSSDWEPISGLLSSGAFTDGQGACYHEYRVRAYLNAPAGGEAEGTDIATSRTARPAC